MEKLVLPYDMECMKIVMLKHEETFKQQVVTNSIKSTTVVITILQHMYFHINVVFFGYS